jgi:hypothetical protein
MLRNLARVFGLTFFLILACLCANATPITVSATTITGYNYGGSTATLRFYAAQTFTASDGTTVPGGAVGGDGFYKSVACTVASTTLSIPQFTIASTTDSLDLPNVTYTAVLFDSKGVKRDTLLAGFRVPISLGVSITWAQLRTYNAAVPRPNNPTYWSADQVGALSTLTSAEDRARANHTGTQLSATISDFTSAVDARYVAAAAASFGYTANVKLAPYNASGSSTTYTCSMTSGSAVLTCTGSTDFVAGQDVFVPGAGAAGANLIATVSSGSGTTWTLGTSASTTVSGVTVKHDDTDAINEAIDAAFDAGGGKVYFPLGYYRVNKPLNAATNSVIYPPQNPYSIGVQTVSITLEGEVPPAWMDINAGPPTGVIIQSDVAGSGNFPAIYSAKVWAANAGASQHLHWNYVQTNFQNLIFRTYNGTTLGGVNLMKAPRGLARNVMVDVGVSETGAYPTTLVTEPTAEVIGFAFPQVASGLSTADNLHVLGYRYGVFFSDHFRAQGFVIATRCYYGYLIEDAAGLAAGHLYAYHSLHTLKFTGTANRIDFTIHMEQVTTGSAWNKVTPGTTVDWTDAGDTAWGQIRFIFTNTSGGTHYAPTLTGMAKVDKVALARSAQAVYYTKSSRTTITTATATDLPWDVELHGGALVTHSTSTNPEQITIDLAGWYEIIAVGHFVTVAGATDNGTGQRQISILLDGVIYDGDPRPANSTLTTAPRAYLKKYLTKGTVVKVQAYQNSGGNLEILGGAVGTVPYSPVLTLALIH